AVGSLKVAVGMPDDDGLGAEHPHSPHRVAVVVRAREGDDGDPWLHGGGVSSTSRIRKFSMTGLGRNRSAISPTCLRAAASSLASTLTSMCLPMRTPVTFGQPRVGSAS